MKHLEFRIRFFLITILCLFSILFVWWLPYFSQYLSRFFGSDLRCAVYVLGAIVGLPILSIFALGLIFPKSISQDRIFHESTASLLKIIYIILGATCFVVAIIGLLLLYCKEPLFSFVFMGLGFIGLLVALMLRVLSHYVRRASVLKEEADATL